jgi:hypothetical protein
MGLGIRHWALGNAGTFDAHVFVGEESTKNKGCLS